MLSEIQLQNLKIGDVVANGRGGKSALFSVNGKPLRITIKNCTTPFECSSYDRTSDRKSLDIRADDELSVFGRLRKIEKLGPYSMMCKLVGMWGPGTSRSLKVGDIAKKVKRFYRYYAINRHKMTTITPSYHAENYSPDDNRYDLRQFLYPVNFTSQFNCIDELVKDLKDAGVD